METGSVSFFKKKVVSPILTVIQQGVTPEKLALSIALGITLGLIPIIGVISIVCAFIAIRLKLNAPIMVICCNLAYPLQMALYVPFIRFGEYTFNIPSLPFSLEEIAIIIKNDWIEAVNRLWVASVLGVFSWTLVAIPLSLCIYYLTLFIFRKNKLKDFVH